MIPDGLLVLLGDAIDLARGPGVTSPSTPAVGAVLAEWVAAPGAGTAGREDDAGDDGVALAGGVDVFAGGGVTAGQVPAEDGGGGSAPACGSYRKPTASPSPTETLDAPTGESTQAPPARETKSTQYEPEPVKQPGG